MQYLFVINPIAGGREKELFVELLEATALEQGLECHQFFTTGENDEERLAALLERLHPHRVAAVGGDGTVHLVGKLLTEMNFPGELGIIPFGSANGLATELGIPADLEASLKVFLESSNAPAIDTILINERYHCLHFADVGINAEVVRESEEDEDRGMLVYAKHLLRRLDGKQRHDFKIRIDGYDLVYDGFMLALANARRLGTNVILNHCGQIADGAFEVVIVRELHLGDLIRAGLSAINVEVEYGEGIECLSCRQAEISLPYPMTLQIDGEVIGEMDHIIARIQPYALRVVLPEPEPLTTDH